jgi:hypothetical protein
VQRLRTAVNDERVAVQRSLASAFADVTSARCGLFVERRHCSTDDYELLGDPRVLRSARDNLSAERTSLSAERGRLVTERRSVRAARGDVRPERRDVAGDRCTVSTKRRRVGQASCRATSRDRESMARCDDLASMRDGVMS